MPVKTTSLAVNGGWNNATYFENFNKIMRKFGASFAKNVKEMRIKLNKIRINF